MSKRKITIQELAEQIWEVEHIRLSFGKRWNDYLFDEYPYTEPMSAMYTVDEFKEIRIKPMLETAILISTTRLN